MAEQAGEKSEQPTPRRLQEARQDGQVAKSPDLTSAILLLAAVIMLYLMGTQLVTRMLHLTATLLRADHAGNPTRSDDLPAVVAFAGQLMVEGLAPMVLAIAAFAIVAGVGQVGFLLTLKPVMPKFTRLDPIKGATQLVNLRAGMRLVMSLSKVVVIGFVAYLIIRQELPEIVGIGDLEVQQAFAVAAEAVFSMGLKLAVLLLILALLDFAYQRWQQNEDMKMTKQEVREEMKRMDGDPLVKQRRARVARQLAMQRAAAAVPQADVIVTNPTHFSVALKYDADTMPAPKVVAKGADFLALRIRRIAAEHNIPIVERKPLARALYQQVEPGQYIPPEHYAAAAEILAYVYRLSQGRAVKAEA